MWPPRPRQRGVRRVGTTPPGHARRADRAGRPKWYVTVWLSTNAPPGVPVGMRQDQGSSDRHDHQKGGRAQRKQRWQVSAAWRRTGSRRRFNPGQELWEPSTSRRPGRAAAQPAGTRSFIAVPLSLRTTDGPPTPESPERPATLPRERHQAGRSDPAGSPPHGLVHPVRLRRQHPVNQHHQHSIIWFRTQPDALVPTDLHRSPVAQIPDPNGQKNLGKRMWSSRMVRQRSRQDLAGRT